MSDSFECAWESVRPVPKVTIDFGNGHTLERTLHGNIATYFCTPAGEVFDLVPGLVDPREYARRLDQASRLHRASSWSRRMSPARARSALDGSAGIVSLLPVDLPVDGASLAPALAAPDPARELVIRWHEALVASARDGTLVAADPIPVFDGSKMRVELRIDLALAPMSDADAALLKADTLLNRTQRYALASQLWLEHPFAKPQELTREVYRRVLHVDLDDPYLGLAPDVLGGEPGRH